jgi:hypothetical protein
MAMGLYLVFATSDLRRAVAIACSTFYMPFSHVAVVSYDGSADELARRLDLDSGGPGTLVGAFSSKRAVGVVAGLVVAVISYGVFT